MTLTWDAPADDGGSPVTNYEVTALTSSGEPVGAFGMPTRFVGSPATSLTFTGLTNGGPYKFRVAAINAVGAGAPVQLADPVKPISVPSAAQAVRLDSGQDRVTLYWEPPLQNGGSPITSYQVSVFDAAGGPATGVTGPTTRSRPASGAGLPPPSFSFAFDGLTLGTAYTFTVAAVSDIGIGASSPTEAIVVGAPTAPSGLTVFPGATGATTGALTVGITSSSGNGSPITSYTVTCTSSNGGATVTKTGSKPVTFTGLLVGKRYNCTARATNARGTSGVSDPATGVVGAPGAPTGMSAQGGPPGQIAVSFVAPSDHGSPIIGYTAACIKSDGSGWTAGGDSSPITVSNLNAGEAYHCSVYAYNARGEGPTSASSFAVA